MRNLIIFTIVVSSQAVMAANKCTAADGSVSFQDSPCAAKTKSEVIELDSDVNGTPNSSKTKSVVSNEPVRIGMTRNEVILAWGIPTKINTSIGSYGKHEQWVYRRTSSVSQYLYIKNDILTSVQTPE